MPKKYIVTATTSANTAHTVTANSPEEAAQAAVEAPPTLCHQCTGGRHGLPELEIGDDLEITGIHDEDGREYPHDPTEVDRLRAEVKELRARLEVAKAGPVKNTLVGDITPGASFIQAGHITGSIQF